MELVVTCADVKTDGVMEDGDVEFTVEAVENDT